MERKMKYLCMGLLLVFTSKVFAQNSTASVENLNEYLTRLVYCYNPLPAKTAEVMMQENALKVMQDNELEYHVVGGKENFSRNPLMLNGKSLDYGTFNMQSKGFLTLVKGNPEKTDAKPILFYISIRRNGNILEDKSMLFLNKALYKINLSKVFPFSQEGDLLIINPVEAKNWKAKRILKLIGGGC
jgi:hypothetical protein